MNQNQSEKAQALTLKILLEWISGLTIAAAIFGFLIVNINLSTYGLWDFNLLNVDYISAGILFLVFLFIAAAPIIFAYDKVLDLRAHRENPRTSPVKKFFIKPLEWILWIGSAAPLGFFLYLVPFIADTAIKISFAIIFILFVDIFVAPIILIAYNYYQEMFSAVKNLSLPPVKEITRRWLMSFKPFYILLGLMGLVLTFGLAIYPFIPHFFGGGSPTFVQIDFADNSFGATSTVATLIYETPDFITFNTEGGTYSVKTSAVSSIQYLQSIPSFRILLPALMYGEVYVRK